MIDAAQLLSALPKPVALFASAQAPEMANLAFAELFGGHAGPEGELAARVAGCETFVTPLARAIAKLRRPGWRTTFRWATSAEEIRVFQVQVTMVEPGRFLAVLDDISDQVKLEEIQGLARRYLEAVLNHLSHGVIVLDEQFNTTFFNDYQASLFKRVGVGKSLFEIIGSPVAENYPLFSDEEWEGIYSRVIRGLEPVTWAKLPYPREAATSYFRITFVPLGGQPDAPGAICITDDMTRMVGLERELIKKERLALVGQMAIALNHEINNPLTAILGTAESLLYKGTLDADMLGRIDLVKANALRIAEVTRKLRGIEEIHLTEYVQGGPMMLDLHAAAK